MNAQAGVASSSLSCATATLIGRRALNQQAASLRLWQPSHVVTFFCCSPASCSTLARPSMRLRAGIIFDRKWTISIDTLSDLRLDPWLAEHWPHHRLLLVPQPRLGRRRSTRKQHTFFSLFMSCNFRTISCAARREAPIPISLQAGPTVSPHP